MLEVIYTQPFEGHHSAHVALCKMEFDTPAVK